MRKGRKTVTRVEGLIVRAANQGFGVEWCELAHAAVLAILMVRPYRSHASTAKQVSGSDNTGSMVQRAGHPAREPPGTQALRVFGCHRRLDIK
jgi:hypothetical protein